MEKVLAVYDRDRLYIERLGNFLRQRRELPFQVYGFSEAEALRQFSRKKEIDILLYAEEEPRLLNGIPAADRILLSEEGTQDMEGGAIYKYQAGDSLVRELLQRYGEVRAEAGGQGAGGSELYMVFSPIGRSGKTGFSLALSRVLSEDRRILFLSLEETGMLFPAPAGKGRKGLSEALYYFKEGNLDTAKLLPLLREEQGFCVLPGMKNPDDLSILSAQELVRFLRLLSELAPCDAIVIDTDPVISRFYETFSLCRRVFVPIREDAASSRKLAVFQRFLEREGTQDAAGFVKLLLPCPDRDISESGFGDGADGGLREYTEAVVRRYIL